MKQSISTSTPSSAFTLIEILLVIVIIGILATLATVAINNARGKARDAKRVADLKQISTALELYYADHNSYPTLITPNQPLLSPDNTKTYLAKIPSNPAPRAEGSCADLEYHYAGSAGNYSLIGCLAKVVGDTPAGARRYEKGGTARGLGPTDGLVGWWMLDGLSGTKDLSGSNNHGTLSVGSPANAVTSTGRFGEENGAYEFDGTNDCVTLGDILESVFNGPNSQMTISLWVYHDGSNSGGKSLLSKYSSSGQRQFNFILYANSIGFAAYHLDGSSYIFRQSNGGTAGTLAWKHLVVTYDNSKDLNNKLLYYFNGVKATVSPNQTGTFLQMTDGTTALQIGCMTSNAVYIKAKLSDIRIYNKVLADNEIQALFNAGR